MDRNPMSISNEEAKRIKEVVAEEFIKLRESLSSSEVEDNLNSSSAQSRIIQVEVIKETSTAVLAKLSEQIAPVEATKGLTKFAIEAKRLKQVNLVREPDVCKNVSCSGKNNEEESRSPTSKRCFGSRYRIVKSPSCSPSFSSSNTIEDSAIDSPVNNIISRKWNKYAVSVRRSSPLSRKEVGNQPMRDFSPIIVDCINHDSRFGVELSPPNFSENIRKSPPKIPQTLHRSNSVEVLSDIEESVVSCGKSGDRQNEVSAYHSVETNYWENFVAHLISIQRNDNLRHLFTCDDLRIFNEFSSLCMVAQTIYIHLLNSELSWYRESAFIHNESVKELRPFIDNLIEKHFITTDPSVEEVGLLVELLSVQELRNLCKILGLRCDGNRRILLESVIKFSKNLMIGNVDKGKVLDHKNFIKEQILKIAGRVVKLNHTHRELFLRTQLLYALPFSETMKVDGRIDLIAVMNDVSGGKVTYPDYAWEPLQKLFTSRESLLRFHYALLLEANIKWKIKSKKVDEVVGLYDHAIIQFQEELRDNHASEESARLPNYLRNFTRGTVLARAVHHSIECLRAKKMHIKMIYAYETLLSQDLYLTSYKGIWYDRLAQIYQHIMRDISKMVIFLTEALVDPSLNFIDRVLLSNRASPFANLKKKRKAETQIYEELKSTLCILKGVREISIKAGCFDGKIENKTSCSYVYETEEGVGQILSSAEEVIKLHFKQCGYSHGLHAPCGIGSSVFGILFWDIIYNVEVPNVFLCPYQSLPLDLMSGDFYVNRQSQINTRLVQIKEIWNDQEMDDHIHRTWSRENGKKSVVSWNIFEDSKQFQVMLKCIGRNFLAKICEKMAKDFYLLQKSFPSMILWNRTTKTCKFIQVKEPNSRLTPSQTSWLLYLSTAGADAFACFVNAVGSKAQKRKLNGADDSMALEDSMVLNVF